MTIEQEDHKKLLRKLIAAKDQIEIIKKSNDSDEYRIVQETLDNIGRIISECNENIRKLLTKAGVDDISISVQPKPKKGEKEKTTARNGTLMVFVVPHTGEVIETRGHNTKRIKELKKEYGAETVMGWRK